MAYYDRETAFRKKINAEKYNELKKYITSKDENGMLNEWFSAYEHIVDLEKQLEEQKKQIEEYKSFFSLMQKLLPRVSSINDIIC